MSGGFYDHEISLCVGDMLYLVVRIKLLVLSLALTQGLSLSLQCLRQVCVLQTFLRVLL